LEANASFRKSRRITIGKERIRNLRLSYRLAKDPDNMVRAAFTQNARDGRPERKGQAK